MNVNLTEMIMVIDRSGSMYNMADEATAGINKLIKEQREREGDVNFTLVQFDCEYDIVHYRKPINEVSEYKLDPRYMTALLDAVGNTINMVGQSLSETPENERPGLVVFCIVTDGLENASKEFTLDRIKEMIKHQQEVYNWEFTFLGANQDAFSTGASMGINMVGTANYNKAYEAYEATSSKFGRMRESLTSGGPVDNSYTDAEIVSMS